MRRVLVFCSLLLMSEAMIVKKDEATVMKALSANLGNLILECQAELEFKQDVINDMLDFWNEKNNLMSEDLGCALVCVFEKNEFLSEDGSKVQEDIVFDFFKEAGANGALSKKLVDLLKLCRKQTSSIKSFCDSALELAKCYRYGIFTMHWNPERFYWKHQPPKSQQSYDTELFTKLLRTCPN